MEVDIQVNNCCGVPQAKLEGDPPALPPRPPPRPRLTPSRLTSPRRRKVRKYVSLCILCGGLACISGASLLSVYLLLTSYTTSLEHFETIPTYIPAAMLIITGIAVMCLARKQNRFIFLMKICRICCIVTPVACMYITITTTVVHMNRLQGLRQCIFTLKTCTCTCYTIPLDSETEHTEPGTIFKNTPGCQVVHGILYSCLRALFGLSVFGVLVCIFCCLLVYQLLSHERKRNYWCQLEMRCRYLYSSSNRSTIAHCACCQHNTNTIQTPSIAHAQPAWDPQQDISRFCTPGNLYTPNPVVDEGVAEDSSQGIRTGWSWRLPWSRASSSHTSSLDCYETPGNMPVDNQYGFQEDGGDNCRRLSTVSYPQLGPPPPYPANSARRPPPVSVCCPVLMTAVPHPTTTESVHSPQPSQLPL